MRIYHVTGRESVTGLEFSVVVSDDGDGLRKSWRVEKAYHNTIGFDWMPEEAPAILEVLSQHVHAITDFFSGL